MAFDQRPTIEELEPGWLDDADREADEARAQNDAASQVPPHDDDAEAAVLSCIVTFATAAPHEDPRLAGVRAGIAAAFELLEPPHFYSERHRRIFEACADLWRAGRPIDSVQVATWLQDRGRLAQVGGWPYLTQVLNAAPAIANVAAYAATVHAKARLRRLQEVCKRADARGYLPVADVDAFVEGVRAEVEGLRAASSKPAATSALTLVERARAMLERGPVVRVATGLPTLDDNCRGGLPYGFVVSVGGAPGVGKTASVVQWAYTWARQGYDVAFVASDEGPDDILIRLALHEGLDREKLEARDPAEMRELGERLVALPTLHLLDADDGWTLERAAAEVVRSRPDARLIIIADSVQTLAAASAIEGESPRAGVDRIMQTAKHLARSGVLVVLTSELGRGAYRNQAAVENTQALAAFKESGGIEYASQIAIVMRSLPKGDGVVEVEIPKARGCAKKGFCIEIDGHARVRECNAPSGPDQQQTKTRELAKLEAQAVDVLRVVVAHPGIGEMDLRREVKAAGLTVGKDVLGAAVVLLRRTGRLRIEVETKGSREFPHYFAVATAASTERTET